MLIDGQFAVASLHAMFLQVTTCYPDAEAVGVDIPIGLPEATVPRQADRAAKALVGPRRSSVFMTAPRMALEAPTHAEAVRRCKHLTGQGMSAQAFALAARIFELDKVDDDRVWEVHPEVSFCALAGEPLEASKKTYNGLMKRKALLRSAGIVLPEYLGPAGEIPVDDLLDAAVAAWSACRIASGTAQSLPSTPEMIRGRPVAIWY